jgi:sarcosine oxidase subunit gamma
LIRKGNDVTASPERASPLLGWAERLARASAEAASFSICELAFITQINLRGNAADAAFAAAVQSLLGFALPLAPNTWSGRAERGALWLGPDEWLVVDSEGQPRDLEAALRATLCSLHHAVTDVSASRTVIEVSGAQARFVLAKGCPLDVHASAFRVPHVAQSMLAKAQVIMQIVEDRPAFRIFVRNSFAAYLAEWFVDAVAECAAARGAGVAADFGAKLG